MLKLNHPKGLYLLFAVEMWERFCYYGMRAIFVLYMVQALQFSTEKAGNIYGIYTGLVYLTPLVGGYLADRYLGQRKCVTIGSSLIAAGLFCMAADLDILFYAALILMIIGNGFFKANISTIVGKLYGDDMSRRDAGYTIFYMGINLGALISPLICGTLAVKYGFKYGFLAAGIGMLIGLITYKLGEKKLLCECGLEPYKKCFVDTEITQENLTQQEKQRVYALFILLFFTIFFWVAFEQAGCSLTLFGEYSTNRVIQWLNFEVPTSWLQSLNPLFIILFAPVMSILWTALGKRGKEPATVKKFAMGLMIISFSFFLMYFVAGWAEFAKVALAWLVIVYFVQTIAELCVSPVGLSLVSKLAPKKFAALLMGTWFLSSFFGNSIAGIFAGQYDSMAHTTFFLILAVATLVMSLVLISMSKLLKKWME